MDTGQTIQKLAQITDAGLFEKLATAILRDAEPEYRPLVHPGVNARGKTVKAPLDGISFVAGAQPPHMIAVHHTICARDDLSKKWLHDPSAVKPRKKMRATSPQGDVLKTIAVVAEERKRTPALRATLVLTTNQEPDEKTVRDVNSVAGEAGIVIDLWPRSRLAHFLDNNPRGQWLRRKFLGVEAERLSLGLLAELSRTSASIHAPQDAPAAWVGRELDHALAALGSRDITFLVAGSGLGKTVACHKWLSAHIEDGGVGLVLSHDIVAVALTIDGAIEAALRQLHPGLAPGAGSEALALCSAERPLFLVVEDINRSGQASLLAEKIGAWASKSGDKSEGKSPVASQYRLVCPLWPEVLVSVSEGARSRIMALSLLGASFSPSEGRAAVQLRAKLIGLTLSNMTADATSAALGNDPLLIALQDPAETAHAERVIADFIERSITRLASSRRDDTPADYRRALLALAGLMLEHRQLDPLWADVRAWPGVSPDDMRLLSHMLHAGELLHLAGASMEQRIGFRHDRLRDWLLVEAATELLRAGKLKDEIVGEPYFAEIIAGVLVLGAVPVEFVDRVRSTNPLALFHALRLFQEPTTGTHEHILSAIDQWLDDPRSADVRHQRLRWGALAALSQTDSSKVVAIVRRFAAQGWTGLLARFRNGDVLGGVELCRRIEPGSGARWRDEQIEHAKLKFGSRLSRTLDRLLRHSDLTADLRKGALRLAGHLADPKLAEAIEACWRLDSALHERLDDYLWAFAECCDDDPERYLKPICDAWAALPSERPSKGLPSPRGALAANHVRWAFRKWVPAAAIAYFVKRAEQEDLRWPITYMLHDIDHPLAIELTAQEMASSLRRVEGSKGFSPFALLAPDEWRRRQEEEGASMSESSRQLLFDYWVGADTDKHLRAAAFRLWAATEGEGDLEILRSAGLPADLSDSILQERLARHDQSAIQQLIEKLQTKERVGWWYSARHVWSEDLLSALDAELARRGANIARDWNAGFESDDAAADLIMRLPPETGEALLEKHWDHLRFSSGFVQAALYLATPGLLDRARVSLGECPNPDKLLEYVDQRFGVKTKGHPGVTREVQVQGLVPYLSLLPAHELMAFWDLCNEHGWYGLRRKHLDPLVRKNGRAAYLDDSLAMASLDEMVKENRVHWIDHWLEDYAKTGASTDTIVGLLAKWLASRKTIESLRLASAALSLIGRRSDLAILDVKLEPVDTSADMLRADTAFAVRRRMLR